MERQKFSVLMSLYIKEKPEYFAQCMQSLLAQTVPADEVVIVEDGPLTEELESVLQGYMDRYPGLIKTVPLPENRGLGLALAAGVPECSYELIARMDTDDIARPDRFEKQLKVMEDPSIDIVGSQITEFEGSPDNIVSRRNVPLEDSDIKRYQRRRSGFNHMTVMYRKSAVLRAGNYQDWYMDEDYYLWVRMMLHGAAFANIDAVLVDVRVGDDMYRRRGGWKYFKSEARLQKYMLNNHVIGLPRFALNVCERFILQILMPNSLRGWVFLHFARNRPGVSEDIPHS